MLHISRPFFSVLVTCLVSGRMSAFATDRRQPTGKVDHMFEVWKMPMSGYNGGNGTDLAKFPKDLGWDDIPALLRHADSTQSLTRILVNPLSSQMQRQCWEGTMALWLIEGIRKGGRFASNNPLCVPDHSRNINWGVPTESTHKLAVTAYKDWWKRVRTLQESEAKQVNPLTGVELHWL